MPHTQRGPSTYEVEGPRRGHRAGLPITRSPGDCPAAPPGRENQPGVPVSRRSAHPPRRSGFPVRRSAGVELISIFGGAEFLPLDAEQCKAFWLIIYRFYGYEQLFHTGGLVIPRGGPLSTGSSTTRSTGGRDGRPGRGWIGAGGVSWRGADGDPAVPHRPGRENHPERIRWGPRGWPPGRGGVAGCRAGPGRARPPAGG
jgi:hypothetical protein